MRARIAIITSLLFLLVVPAARASPRSWEEILADTQPARASAAAAAASSSAKKKPTAAPVPAVSLALATAEATIFWDDAKGEYGCAVKGQPGGDAPGAASCAIYPGTMSALFLDCPAGQAATAPSCYHPVLGDSPTVVYGWFVRGPTLACGFTYPPRQDAPFTLGASAYCMTVNEFDAPKRQQHGRGL